MNRSTSRETPTSWFTGEGPDADVIVSSRVRLARNLAGYRFPPAMDADERRAVIAAVDGAVSAAGEGLFVSDHSRVFLDSLRDRPRLVERNLVPSTKTGRNPDVLYINADETAGVLVNGGDHLRIFGIGPGRRIVDLRSTVEAIDGALDKVLDYAASLDLGFLAAGLADVGTGEKASIMIHVPGLAEKDALAGVFADVRRAGFVVRGFVDERQSLGNLFLIECRSTGPTEGAELDDVAAELIHYERRARNEILDSKRDELEQRLARAIGALRFSRRIDGQTVIPSLSTLRLGLCLGIVDGTTLGQVTSLFFLAQKFHILYVAGGSVGESDSAAIEQLRAKVISETLGPVEVRG